MELPDLDSQSFDTTWAPYPPDVPREKRKRCSVDGCGRPADMVETLMGVFPGTGVIADGDLYVIPYCAEHAKEKGWNPEVPHPQNVAHLNEFQRWLGHVLDHGDPKHLA